MYPGLEILTFFIGLLVGLGILVARQIVVTKDLDRLLNKLDPDLASVPLPHFSRLVSGINRQKLLTQKLEDQLALWKQILYVAPIAYLQVDDENRLCWCNQTGRQLLGIQDWEGSTPRLLLELVRSYELDQLIEETRLARRPQSQEWIFRLPPPTKLSQPTPNDILLRSYAIPMANGSIGVFLESRQEVMILSQQRDRWTSDVAHELKTPLTSIRLVAEALQTRLEPNLRAWVDRLLSEVIRLSNLVQDLLDLSQLQVKPSTQLQMKSFNLAEIVQAAWLNLEPLARKKRLQLDYVGPNPAIIRADEARLYRVLINLLDNSIKYSPPRQTIRVQVSFQPVDRNFHLASHSPLPEPYDAEPAFLDWSNQNSLVQPACNLEADISNRQVCIEVIDAGTGFPEASLPYVFERFYRVDSSRSRTKLESEYVEEEPDRSVEDPEIPPFIHAANYNHSSGLGLAIVRQIVEAHRGSVLASNHPETGGAWLQVFLPCHPP